MSTPNEELAASVGQDKAYKCGSEAYDAKHGKYNPPAIPASPMQSQAPSTVQPFAGLRSVG